MVRSSMIRIPGLASLFLAAILSCVLPGAARAAGDDPLEAAVAAMARVGRLAFGTNERDPAGVDAVLFDPRDASRRRVAEIAGTGGVQDVTRDGKYALVYRLAKRGDDNLYLADLTRGGETLLTPHQGP